MSPQRTLKTAAVAMMIGSICPWASLLGIASASGLAVTYGWITLLAGAAVLWLTYRPGQLRRYHRRIALTLAVIAAICCLLVIAGASHTELGAAMHASWGAYLTLIASIVTAASARTALQ